jgi:hypothetical protein
VYWDTVAAYYRVAVEVLVPLMAHHQDTEPWHGRGTQRRRIQGSATRGGHGFLLSTDALGR